jgi:Tfp pilus assembly protein PilO
MMKKLNSSKVNLRPLTKSEKTLLSLLVIALIVYFSNRFLLTPQSVKIHDLEVEIAELDSQIADMQNTMKNEDNIKKEWEMLHRERDEILKHYFPVLDQAQILYLLNDLIKDERVAISQLSFNAPEEEVIGEMGVKKMNISVPYNGTYDGTIEIVKALSSSPRRIVVDNLLMERGTDSEISGNMSLKIYSLEGIAETDPDAIPVETVEGSSQGSLFASYEGYVESGGAIGSRPGGGSGAIDERDFSKVFMLHDFEVRNYSFVPSNDNIKGNVEPSTIKKSGKYSLRFEYNIFAIGKENRAYIDLGTDIIFNYPPQNISMWVNAFGYSPGTLGLRFRKPLRLMTC